MEYDWKRRPLAAGWSEQYGHLMFSTQPWQSIEQFVEIRNAWDDFTREGRLCIKNLQALDAFATYVDSHIGMPKDLRRYLKKDGPDIARLRALLCSAWKQSQAGLNWQEDDMSATEFAEILCEIGISCKKTDVENGKRRPFIPHSCPPTALAREKLEMLKLKFPNLQTDAFLHVADTSVTAISIHPTTIDCPHVALAVTQQLNMLRAA